jgi:hypothetical protein
VRVTPYAATSNGATFESSAPEMRTRPSSNGSTPVSRLMSVVFPEPLGPMRPVTAPCCIEIERPSTPVRHQALCQLFGRERVHCSSSIPKPRLVGGELETDISLILQVAKYAVGKLLENEGNTFDISVCVKRVTTERAVVIDIIEIVTNFCRVFAVFFYSLAKRCRASYAAPT